MRRDGEEHRHADAGTCVSEVSTMAFSAGLGFSEHKNPTKAAREAVDAAKAQLETHTADLVIVFATVGHKIEPLVGEVRAGFEGARLVGCSVEGIISSAGITEGNFGVCVAAFSTDELKFSPILVEGLSEDAEAVGRRFGELAGEHLGDDTMGLMLFPDGTHSTTTPSPGGSTTERPSRSTSRSSGGWPGTTGGSRRPISSSTTASSRTRWSACCSRAAPHWTSS